jgi:capsular exopolysaccharide synthesis family protein
MERSVSPAGPERETLPSSLTEGVQLRDYWRLLVRRKSVVLASVVAVVAVAGIFVLLATPHYRATATVQIERQGPDILDFKDVLNVDPAGYQEFYQTQYMILQSRAVIRRAAERIDLLNRPEYATRKRSPLRRLTEMATSTFSGRAAADGDPLDRAVRFIEDGLAVVPVRNSHLVDVSFVDRDPPLARDVANAVVEAYQQFNLDARYSTTKQASEFLTRQVVSLRSEIAEKERQLQEFSEKKEILSVNDETKDISGQALADLSRRVVEARGRLALAQARYESVHRAEPDALTEVTNNSMVNGLKQQKATLERKLTLLSGRFKGEWPEVDEVGQELAKADEQLQAEIAAIAAQVRGAAGADMERAESEVVRLERQLEQQKEEVRRVHREAGEFAGLKAEIENKRAFLNDLVSRQSQTEVSDRLRDTRASNVHVVDRAQLPKTPSKPNKPLVMMVSLLLGMLVGIGAAIVLDHLDYTVKSAQEIERLTALPILGRIPLFQPLRAVKDGGTERERAESTTSTDLGSHLDPQSAFAEAFKNLRTSLLLASPDRPPKNIVVTSCEPRDGKSTTSVNLAIVLTQLGRRVLLIDADLRRPRIHKMFGIPSGVGLSSLLTGNAAFEDVPQTTVVPGLAIITSGPIPPTPSELLGSPALQALLDRLQRDATYDHVILDCPPSLQVADSVILASRADATIVVVRPGKTSRESLAHGVVRLRQARAYVVGAVLNAMPEDTSGYYYHYYRSDEDEKPHVAGRGQRRRRAGTA